MREELTIEELKALCELFFNAGERRQRRMQTSPGHWADQREQPALDFEEFFNSVMQGKYDKAIESNALQLKFYEMQKDIDAQMEGFDLEERIRIGQAMEELRKIVITA